MVCEDVCNTVWFKEMDLNLYIYISWTIQGMWMMYITFERGDPNVSIFTTRALAYLTAVQQRQLRAKWLLCSTRFLWVREFIKTESATAVQRAFRLRFNIQPPTRKSICRWNHQFEQIGCLCKGKSSGRPRVSEENVRRIQENFERSPRKSTRRASRELGIPQPTIWRVLRRRLLFNWVHLFESLCISEQPLWQYKVTANARHRSILWATFTCLLYSSIYLKPPISIRQMS